MKINEETTVSEEQVLFNKLKWEEQQFILKQMRMLQPCELSCEVEEPQEHKIPEKFEIYDNSIEWCCNGRSITDNEKDIMNKINEILDYLEEIE